jgi:hypothetical protein
MIVKNTVLDLMAPGRTMTNEIGKLPVTLFLDNFVQLMSAGIPTFPINLQSITM